MLSLPGPLVIVNMSRGEPNEQYIRRDDPNSPVQGVLSIQIDDSPDGCLGDQVLLSLVRAAEGIIRSRVNLLIHCGAGVSRAAYFNVALHMRVLDMSYDDALSYIRKARLQSNPNPGFEAQLRRLSDRLRCVD